MEINAYQPCPCHAERKIKFCCGKQIVGDLNAVMTLSSAGQTIAAVDKLERLLQTWGEKDCLLTLRTHLLLELSEIDRARESNTRFLQKNPKHPMGLLHQALLCLAEQDIGGAIRASQDAMDTIKGTSIPVAFANAYRLLGLSLLRQGEPFAARAHLRFALTLRPNDEQIYAMLRQSLRHAWGTTLRKYDPVLPVAPPEPLWSRTYQQVRRLIQRGQWRTAMHYIERKMLPENPQEPVLHRTVAILAMWLCDQARASAAWRAYAQCPGVSLQEAVEAYSWIMALGERLATRTVEQTQQITEVRDLQGLLERLQTEPQVVELPPPEEIADPQARRYGLLDKLPPDKTEPIDYSQIPLVVAELLVYGPGESEGEGPTLLEVRWWHDADAQTAVEQLDERLGATLDRATRRTAVLGQVGEDNARLTWFWELPEGLTREQTRQLDQAMANHRACESWTAIPLAMLDGKSPQEVAEDAAYRPQLLALIAQFETNDSRHPYNQDTARAVRARLGLPEPAPIDPQVHNPKLLSPVWLLSVDWAAAGDQDLLMVTQHAITSAHHALIERLAREIVRREPLHAQVDMGALYRLLAEATLDDEQALEWSRRARKQDVSRGQSPGLALMFELELRLARGISEKTPELFQEITSRYLQEPEVAQRFAQLMAMLGISRDAEVDSDDDESGEEASVVVPATERSEHREGAGRKLWLPGDP